MRSATPWTVFGEDENDAGKLLPPADGKTEGSGWPYVIAGPDRGIGYGRMHLARGIQSRDDADIMARAPELLAMLQRLLAVSELHADDMEEHTIEVMRDAGNLIADIDCGVDGPPVHELRAERVRGALQTALNYLDREIKLQRDNGYDDQVLGEMLGVRLSVSDGQKALQGSGPWPPSAPCFPASAAQREGRLVRDPSTSSDSEN
jgi:hypothetical protein